MTVTDYLGISYPKLANKLRKISFASLPTPVTHHEVELRGESLSLVIKNDGESSPLYGGNKIRKLEYILQRAKDRGAERVATFGAVGSNHALATAIHARQLEMECTCFLAHQKATPNISTALSKHLQLGTELVRYGSKTDRLQLFRRYLQNRKTWVIPLGGSCWLGAVGFVNAGLELAAQIEAGDLETPQRIYIANGTMGSVAGLSIGLMLAGLGTTIHAVRVADNRFARREVLDRLMLKTATLLNRLDPSVAASVATGNNIVWRDDFFAGAYAAVDDATLAACKFAKRSLDLTLDTTYTGKAMAAMLHDLKAGRRGLCLFWNTYNSRPLNISTTEVVNKDQLPDEFLRYFKPMDSEGA
jgi:D-cysteine desulfhydrase